MSTRSSAIARSAIIVSRPATPPPTIRTRRPFGGFDVSRLIASSLRFLGHRGVSRRRGLAPSARTLRPLRQTRKPLAVQQLEAALSVVAPRPLPAIPDGADVRARVPQLAQTRGRRKDVSVTLNRCANSARDNDVLTRVNDVDLYIR